MKVAARKRVSVRVSADDLRWAREHAKKTQISVSAVFAEAVRLQRQAEARSRLLASLGTADIDEQDIAQVRREWLKSNAIGKRASRSC